MYANDIQTVIEAIDEFARFGTRFSEAWERVKKVWKR